MLAVFSIWMQYCEVVYDAKSSERDAVSSCPSLLDILQLTNHADILNCKLLNRRFCDVVQRNYHQLPRPTATIKITCHGFDEDAETYKVSVTTGRNASSFKCESNIFTLSRCDNRYLLKYFDVHVVGPARPAWHTVKHSLNSAEQALFDVLSVLFRHYYVNLIFVNSSLEEFPSVPFINNVSHSLRLTKSKCSSVNMEYMCPGLANSLQKLGCRDVQTRCLFASLDEQFGVIDNWESTHFKFEIAPRDFDSSRPIVTLLSKWKAGHICIFFITLSCARNATINSLKISHNDFVRDLESLEPLSIEILPFLFGYPNGAVDIKIQRPSDGRKIWVQYSQPFNMLRILELTDTRELIGLQK